MMEVESRTFKRKISVLFFIIVLLGASISLLVYTLGKEVRRDTVKLLHDEIPNYSAFLRLRNHLSEQERSLYEYYASFNEYLYTHDYLTAQRATVAILEDLSARFGDALPLKNIQANQDTIDKLAEEFHDNMILQPDGTTDWDLARFQLSQLSLIMRSTMFDIVALTEIYETDIRRTQERVDNLLNWVNAFVLFYCLLSVVVAIICARAFATFLKTSSIKQRLELIPKRTPNPIISLDEFNRVSYINPATKRLLARMGHDESRVDALLPERLNHYQESVIQADNRFETFDMTYGGVEFLCELHWLPMQKQWDLHLSDITAQRDAEEKLEFQAYHHPESSLPNQYRLNEVLDELSNNTKDFILGIVEVRSFRHLISSLGNENASQTVNAIGAVLQSYCTALADNVRLFHITDKNFAIVDTSGQGRSYSAQMVTEMRNKIRATDSLRTLQMQLDFGFCEYPVHADSREQVLRNARIALDASASDIDSSLMFYNHSMREAILHKQQLQQSIREALESHEFRLHYQPQISPANHQIVGVEALIRWTHDRQEMSPASFIPVAESDGLIHDLGKWTLSKACEQASILTEKCGRQIPVAVNISAKQFSTEDFVDMVESALAKTQLLPSQLELEITESTLFNNEAQTVANLHALKSMGVKLAIDDFGTGYSSLSYLQHLPVDKLKIDRSFIRDLDSNQANRAIVQSVITLGKSLELIVVAEGVETEAEQQVLHQLGCDVIQGFFYSYPLPMNELCAFIKD